MNLLDALASSNVRAFLVMIRHGEGTSDDDGYRRMFGGELFDNNFADHPRRVNTFALKGGGGIASSAAGAYQFLTRTWDGLVRQWGFKDFSPHSQDLGAIALILGRKALDDVIAGRFDAAVRKCNKEWASLPGSPYGQPTTTLEKARQVYQDAGGAFAEEPEARPAPMPEPEPPLVKLEQASYETPADADMTITPTKGPTMAPFLLAALPALFDAVPKLVKTFTDDGATVPKRNQQAIQIAVDVAKQALNVQTEQQLAEAVKADPQAAAAVRAAIDASWATITDAGGIPEARAADAAFVARGEPVWRSPSLVISLALLPLVYLLVGAVVGLFGAPFSDDVRSAIANGVIGLILGGLTGYYFGQTTTRNRTPAGPQN